MGLTLELVSFAVRQEDEGAMLAERPEMIAAVQRALPGVLGAWLTKQDDGSWLDMLLWRSREEAEVAIQRIGEVPAARRWFRHIAESKGIRHVEVAHQQLFALQASEEPARSQKGPDPT